MGNSMSDCFTGGDQYRNRNSATQKRQKLLILEHDDDYDDEDEGHPDYLARSGSSVLYGNVEEEEEDGQTLEAAASYRQSLSASSHSLERDDAGQGAEASFVSRSQSNRDSNSNSNGSSIASSPHRSPHSVECQQNESLIEHAQEEALEEEQQEPQSPLQAILELSQKYAVDSSTETCPWPQLAQEGEDYRAFCVLIHKTHGVLLLHCTRKAKKPPHYQLPGGHVDDEEFEVWQDHLFSSAQAGCARELWEETGIDFRYVPAIDRLCPLILYPEYNMDGINSSGTSAGHSPKAKQKKGKKKSKKQQNPLPNEFKQRLFFVATIDDSDFLHKPDPKRRLTRARNHGLDLFLPLSVEHSGFWLEPDFYKAMELLQLHSGGKVSQSLSMALNVATLPKPETTPSPKAKPKSPSSAASALHSKRATAVSPPEKLRKIGSTSSPPKKYQNMASTTSPEKSSLTKSSVSPTRATTPSTSSTKSVSLNEEDQQEETSILPAPPSKNDEEVDEMEPLTPVVPTVDAAATDSMEVEEPPALSRPSTPPQAMEDVSPPSPTADRNIPSKEPKTDSPLPELKDKPTPSSPVPAQIPTGSEPHSPDIRLEDETNQEGKIDRTPPFSPVSPIRQEEDDDDGDEMDEPMGISSAATSTASTPAKQPTSQTVSSFNVSNEPENNPTDETSFMPLSPTGLATHSSPTHDKEALAKTSTQKDQDDEGQTPDDEHMDVTPTPYSGSFNNPPRTPTNQQDDEMLDTTAELIPQILDVTAVGSITGDDSRETDQDQDPTSADTSLYNTDPSLEREAAIQGLWKADFAAFEKDEIMTPVSQQRPAESSPGPSRVDMPQRRLSDEEFFQTSDWAKEEAKLMQDLDGARLLAEKYSSKQPDLDANYPMKEEEQVEQKQRNSKPPADEMAQTQPSISMTSTISSLSQQEEAIKRSETDEEEDELAKEIVNEFAQEEQVESYPPSTTTSHAETKELTAPNSEISKATREDQEESNPKAEEELSYEQLEQEANRLLSIQLLEDERAKIRHVQEQKAISEAAATAEKMDSHANIISRMQDASTSLKYEMTSQFDQVGQVPSGVSEHSRPVSPHSHMKRKALEASIFESSEAPSEKSACFILLISKMGGNAAQRGNQARSLSLLQARNLPCILIDGSDPSNRDIREDLFGLSGIRGQYPQLFLKRGDESAFVGDYDTIVYLNESGTLSTLIDQANEDSNSFTEGAANQEYHSESTVLNGKSLLMLLSSMSGNQSQKSNQDRALMILHSHQIHPEQVDGSDPSLRNLRNELFALSGIRGNYPQFFIRNVSDNHFTFFGGFDVLEQCNDGGSLKEGIFG